MVLPGRRQGNTGHLYRMDIPPFRIGLVFSWLLGSVPGIQGQSHPLHDRAIHFPDVPGYYTLSCDLHEHTVFSDGSVWPNIRVQEALRDSMDAISLTEHLEHQPHAADIPNPDRNRSYEIARDQARAFPLIVIHGAEITRKMPPGHTNAIFIQDANALRKDDVMEVFREARDQGAFLFWNHPDWTGQVNDGIARLTPMHERLIREGFLHGIEVVNDRTYSDEALQIALDQNLAILGTSDIHGLVDWQFDVADGGHRPVTLVLARERTAESIREALFERRTIAWHKNNLIGREPELVSLIQASILVEKAEYFGARAIAVVTLRNESDADFLLANRSGFTLQEDADVVVLPHHSETRIHVRTGTQLENFDLVFEVLNAIRAPGLHPVVRWPVRVE